MNPTDTARFLKDRVPLFEDFGEDQLAELVAGSRVATFEPSEAVIEFGSEGLFLGVLIEGEAEVSVTDDAGDKHRLGTVGVGDIFGETSVMTGAKTMADVIGVTLCKALLVPRGLFSTLLTTHASAIACLSKTLVERARTSVFDEDGRNLAAAALERSGDPYGFKLKTGEPMKLLVVNCGSSSLKYHLFDTGDDERSASGAIERIGIESTRHTYRSAKGEVTHGLPEGGHAEAFAAMMAALTAPDTGVIESPSEIVAVGHRVVHGGDKYSHQVLITDDVILDVEKAAELAPLHNPLNLVGIREATRLFPHAKQVAVFDTAFHQTMPAYAYLYGLPYEYFEDKRIRRYGFHGTSHKYVALKTAEFLKRPFNELETIVCHLGNGASICAVDHGRSIDTSMGLTPAEGLIMGTRCGDIDPAILVHLMRTEGLDAEGLDRLINRGGGLKGLSGISSDMREIEEAANRGGHRALLAIKTFSYRVRKYIGSYAAAMGGLDAVAFTGGIGEGSVGVRTFACQGLRAFGIRIDERKNREAGACGGIRDISADGSSVRVLVVPTDEERMIARETLRVLERSYVAEIIQRQEPVPIPIEVSAHHIHLSDEHAAALFGEGHELTPLAELSQPGQYACEERVNLAGPRGTVNGVRVLGPTRKATQVEIAMTEQFKLGIDAPIRESGDLDGSPGITLEGARGSIAIEQGVICALRHIHMTPEDALRMGLKDKDMVRVNIPGKRELVFGDVLVRVSPAYKLAMHIDTDEGTAANIGTGVSGYVDGIQSRR